MVIIEEIEINNCFLIPKLFLRFGGNNFCTILNSPKTHELKDSLILAIQPFLLKEFSNTPIRKNPNCSLQQSNIRIRFIIPKGKFQHNIIVDAMRTSARPNFIYYYFDGEQYIDHIDVYHERCRIDVTHLFPYLNKVFTNDNKNLLSIWFQNENPELTVDCEKSYELFSNYYETSRSLPESETEHLDKLIISFLTIDKHIELLQRRNFIDVVNEIGKVFNYLTFEKYSIHFCVPLAGQNVNIHEMQWTDMWCAKAETYIFNTEAKTSVLWNSAEPCLKFILKISQQLVMSKSLGQLCLIIKDSSLIQEYQDREMIKEAIIESVGVNTTANWKNKNLLSRIAKICNEKKILLLINYHGGLPLIPENVNLIKFCSLEECNQNNPPMYLCRDSESLSLGSLIQLLSQSRNDGIEMETNQ